MYLCFPVRAYYQLKAYQTIPRKKNISMLYSAYGFFPADITDRHETDINQKDKSRIGNRFSFYADMGCNKRRSTGLCRGLYRTVVRLGIYRVGNSRNAHHTASAETAAEGRVNASGRFSYPPRMAGVLISNKFFVRKT